MTLRTQLHPLSDQLVNLYRERHLPISAQGQFDLIVGVLYFVSGL